MRRINKREEERRLKALRETNPASVWCLDANPQWRNVMSVCLHCFSLGLQYSFFSLSSLPQLCSLFFFPSIEFDCLFAVSSLHPFKRPEPHLPLAALDISICLLPCASALHPPLEHFTSGYVFHINLNQTCSVNRSFRTGTVPANAPLCGRGVQIHRRINVCQAECLKMRLHWSRWSVSDTYVSFLTLRNQSCCYFGSGHDTPPFLSPPHFLILFTCVLTLGVYERWSVLLRKWRTATNGPRCRTLPMKQSSRSSYCQNT